MSLYSELEWRGLLAADNQTAADVMRTVCAGDIAVHDAANYLRVSLLWFNVSPTLMAGSIQDALDLDSLPPEIEEGLGELYANIFSGAADVVSVYSNSTTAVRVRGGIEALITAAVMTVDQETEWYALGGGLMFPNCTAENVQEARDLEAERIALEEAEIERQEKSSQLMMENNTAQENAGVEEALYEGDKPALIVALRDTADSLEG